jgi:selenocysteine lyase/cysteine desulfurase
MVRVGLTHYNEPTEIERLVEALREIAEPTATPSRPQS